MKKKIKSFKKFYKDEDETVFSGPGEEEAKIKGEIMFKKKWSGPCGGLFYEQNHLENREGESDLHQHRVG